MNKVAVIEKALEYTNNIYLDVVFIESDILILAGWDHLYWYNNAKYDGDALKIFV